MNTIRLQSRLLWRNIPNSNNVSQIQRLGSISFYSTRQSQPELFIQKQDGIDKIIPNDDLYRYTKHRWLYDLMNGMNSPSDTSILICSSLSTLQSVSDGAESCTRVVKCSEGLHNKAFILTMDNGMEVFAKLPNPNAGPTCYATASEVATLELLRDAYKIPVPRVLAWSSNASNPVEAEYIIEEKAPGVRLGSVWHQWPRELKLRLIRQVVDIENTLSSIVYPKHGSIYFKADLRELTGHAEDIEMDDSTGTFKGFSIGPLTSAELWSGDKGNMKFVDRGPWQNAVEYTQALGRNEISWIRTYAKPRMNYHRSSRDHELPSDGLALLRQYMDVAPYLVPTDKAASSNVLWHPDLHLDNIFVDPDTYGITRIVDWQSACVAPLFYQSSVPRMFRHTGAIQEGWTVPERPDNFESLSNEEQKKIDADLESQIIHKYYEAQVYKRASLH